MHDLGNLVALTGAFHSRMLNPNQFLPQRRNGVLNFPNQHGGGQKMKWGTSQAKTKTSKGKPSEGTSEASAPVEKPQGYSLPETRQWGPEQDDPVARNKMRNLAAKAQAFGAAMDQQGKV